MDKKSKLSQKHPSKHETLYDICTILNQHRSRWAVIVQMLYKSFFFAEMFVLYLRRRYWHKHVSFLGSHKWTCSMPDMDVQARHAASSNGGDRSPLTVAYTFQLSRYGKFYPRDNLDPSITAPMRVSCRENTIKNQGETHSCLGFISAATAT